MVAPPVLTALVIGSGVPGWIGLAAIFAAAGLIFPHVVRWGLRRVAAQRPYAATASGAKTTTIPALSPFTGAAPNRGGA